MTGSVNRQYEAIIVSQLDTKVRKTMNLPEMFTSLSTPRLDFIVIHLESFSYFIYSYIQTCKYVTYYKIITSARNLNLICIGCIQGQVNHVCQFYLLVLCILHSKDFPLILPKFILKKTV